MNAPSFVLRSVFVGLNYRALTDAVSRDRSPSFSVSPIFRTDTGRFMRPPLAFEPLITKFFSGNIECAVDVGIDRRTIGGTVQTTLFSIAGKLSLDRLFIETP